MIFQGPGSPSRSQFLAEYWQRRPCLLRQAFPGFVPELDENDIAGLACDELAEARLITGSYPQQDWCVKYGPFTAAALRRLPSHRWTLLVQDVEKHYPPIASLMGRFDFLPGWRLDDLMVSVSGPEGSVGPHYDQYDVFLLQASGRRRWQIATEFDPLWQPGCELNVLASFTPETEWEVEPGDILYLPPGIAHHGVALETGMTWSIGLRAPSQADLLQALGEWLAEHENEGVRYQDGLLVSNPRPGEISAQAIEQLYALLQQPQGQASKLHSFFASFLTRYRLAQQPAAPDHTMDETELAARLENSAVVQRNPWTRLAWIDRDGEALLCAAGDQYTCSIETAQRLCATPLAIPGDGPMDEATLQLVCRLINEGHLFLSLN
jgi:50S ribosomal protein L16 3-hydroxylase